MLQTAKYCITVTLKGSLEARSALPTFAWACREMVSQMTLRKHSSGNHWPSFRGGKQRVFALLSFGTKFFLFMRLSQSLESWKKTSQLLLDGDLGPGFKWWVLASLRQTKGPTAALGCWEGGRTGWGCARAEAQSSPGWICPWHGKKIAKAHQVPSAPAGETEHPDVKKTIYRSISCCQYWMTSVFLADKFKSVQKHETIEQIHIKRKGVGRTFRF